MIVNKKMPYSSEILRELLFLETALCSEDGTRRVITAKISNALIQVRCLT
jgi:hypothetical protein